MHNKLSKSDSDDFNAGFILKIWRFLWRENQIFTGLPRLYSASLCTVEALELQQRSSVESHNA